MAQLKWDNVTAPAGSSGSTSGIETAAKLISGGFGGVADALGQFSDRQALEQLSRYTDAQQLQKDLQSGAFNTGNASDKALASIMGRPAALITNAFNQQVVDNNAVMNPLNQRYRQLEVDNKIATDPLNQETLRLNNAYDAAVNPLLVDEKTFGNRKARLDFSRGEEARTLGMYLGQQWADYKQNNLMTPEAAYAFREQFKDNPVAYQMATALITREVPGFGQAIVSPSLGSIPGTGGTVPVAGGAVDSGQLFGSLLLTESNGQQFNKDGSAVTSPKGATGIAQVMPATGPEAAELAGLPWDPEKFKKDPEYNKALGKAYFDKQLQSFGNDPAKALAAYNAGPGATQKAIAQASAEGKPDAWLNYLPKETQDYVPKTLGRLNGQQTAALSNKVTQDNTTSGQLLQAANMFSDTGLMNAAAAAYKKDPEGLESDQAVATRLTGEGGSLKRIGTNDVRSAIQQVQTELGVSAAVAGTIVERAISGGFLSSFGRDSQKIDSDKLGNLLDTIGGKRGRDGKYENRNKVSTVLDALVKNTASDNARSKLESSQKEISEITARIRQLEGVGTPAAQAALAAENAKLVLAQVKQQQALESTSSVVQGLVGDLTPPPPPAPTPLKQPSVPARPATPIGAVSPGSGNTNAVRGLDYYAASQYWQDQAKRNAEAREQESAAEAARKAKEAKEEVDRRIAATRALRERFPEAPILNY